jgi:hypothetical protein
MLVCNITIGPFTFGFADNVEITSSWKQLVDTCHIKLPRRIANGYWNQTGTRLDTVIKRGMAVNVQIGYGGSSLPTVQGNSATTDSYTTVFAGFVSVVHPGIPVRIDCEDNMFKLKQLPVAPRQFVNPTLNQVLDYCNISSVFPYTTLGTVSISNFVIDRSTGTALKVLKRLKERYKIYAFLRTINNVQKLVVGQPYDASGNAPQQTLEFGQNIVDEGSLKYMDADDILIELQAVGKNYAGQELSVTVGDSGGDHYTRYYVQPTLDAKLLKTMAQRDLAYYKYTGYRGRVTAFGLPTINHGDIVMLEDPDWGDRNGSYFVDEVKTDWGKEGFRQHVELGPRSDVVYNINNQDGA